MFSVCWFTGGGGYPVSDPRFFPGGYPILWPQVLSRAYPLVLSLVLFQVLPAGERRRGGGTTRSLVLPRGGGTWPGQGIPPPSQVGTGGGTPSLPLPRPGPGQGAPPPLPPGPGPAQGVPPPPPPPPPGDRRASTCYAVGGRPVAVMQEDFLVKP